MARNPISGSFPSSLATTTTLGVIDVSNTGLTGDLSHLNLTAGLTNLHLENNELSGTLPDLSRCTNLISVLLYHNRLSGTLGDGLFGGADFKRSLEYLSLSNNRLEGTLPEHLCQLTRLEALTASFTAPTLTRADRATTTG